MTNTLKAQSIMFKKALSTLTLFDIPQDGVSRKLDFGVFNSKIRVYVNDYDKYNREEKGEMLLNGVIPTLHLRQVLANLKYALNLKDVGRKTIILSQPVWENNKMVPNQKVVYLTITIGKGKSGQDLINFISLQGKGDTKFTFKFKPSLYVKYLINDEEIKDPQLLSDIALENFIDTLKDVLAIMPERVITPKKEQGF